MPGPKHTSTPRVAPDGMWLPKLAASGLRTARVTGQWLGRVGSKVVGLLASWAVSKVARAGLRDRQNLGVPRAAGSQAAGK